MSSTIGDIEAEGVKGTLRIDLQRRGESVIVTRGDGSATIVLALVERRGKRDVSETNVKGMGGMRQDIRVLVLNDATDGVTEVEEGVDTITLDARPNDASPTEFMILEVVSVNKAFFELGVG